jgi:hypothetical protein
MEVTSAGMMMALRTLASANAFAPMVVSLLPTEKVTVVRLVAFLNA